MSGTQIPEAPKTHLSGTQIPTPQYPDGTNPQTAEKVSATTTTSFDTAISSGSGSESPSTGNQMPINLPQKLNDKHAVSLSGSNSTTNEISGTPAHLESLPQSSSMTDNSTHPRNLKDAELIVESDVKGKRYHCSTCGKGFTRKHNMVSHELIHSQSKPHDCSVCSATFRRIHDLKRHEKLHTGEKPFKCEYCPRSFARPDSLTRHQNSQNACPGYTKAVQESIITYPNLGNLSAMHSEGTIDAASEADSSVGPSMLPIQYPSQSYFQTTNPHQPSQIPRYQGSSQSQQSQQSHQLYQSPQPPQFGAQSQGYPVFQGARPELPPLRSISNLSRSLYHPQTYREDFNSYDRRQLNEEVDDYDQRRGTDRNEVQSDDRGQASNKDNDRGYTTTTTITTTHYRDKNNDSDEDRKKHNAEHQRAVDAYQHAQKSKRDAARNEEQRHKNSLSGSNDKSSNQQSSHPSDGSRNSRDNRLYPEDHSNYRGVQNLRYESQLATMNQRSCDSQTRPQDPTIVSSEASIPHNPVKIESTEGFLMNNEKNVKFRENHQPENYQTENNQTNNDENEIENDNENEDENERGIESGKDDNIGSTENQSSTGNSTGNNLNIALGESGVDNSQAQKKAHYNQPRGLSNSMYQFPSEEYISLSRYQELVAYTQSLEESLYKINSRISLLEDESADNKIEIERAKQANDARHKHKRQKRSSNHLSNIINTPPPNNPGPMTFQPPVSNPVQPASNPVQPISSPSTTGEYFPQPIQRKHGSQPQCPSTSQPQSQPQSKRQPHPSSDH